MAEIVLRSIKGSPLTIAEADANFSNLNAEVGIKLTATDYNAADILTKIKTVDGAASGLDADLLDGLNSSNTHVDGVATVVSRNSSGNFSANTITSNLVGNVTGNVIGNLTGNVTGNATNVSGNVAINNGGTGATTVAGARTALGLGSVSTQESNEVNITGGSITGITDLSIADGGTGASNVISARTNLGLVIGADIQPFSNELTALSSLTTPGLFTKISTGVVSRTITAGNAVNITNGDGVAGNPVINLSNELVALSTLNTFGVINRTSTGVQTVAPSTSGNILTSNGTTWVSSTPTPPQIIDTEKVAKAWVNYNASTQTIRSSHNVSSVTYNSTGNFTINFTTAMPNADYVTLASIGPTAGTVADVAVIQSYTTSNVRIVTSYFYNQFEYPHNYLTSNVVVFSS